jgi:GTP-binding protein
MKRRGRRNHVPHHPSRLGDLPLVAVLGRPNVGKSTLFNRLVGRAVSIVEDRPGVTRDRLYADADIDDKRCTLVDMGGWEISPDGPVEEGINRQCRIALEQSDLILFVVDGRATPTNGDHETVDILRRSQTPSIMVINKIDGAHHESGAGDCFSLGLDPFVMVSALHGRGFGALEDLIYERLPQTDDPQADDEDDIEQGEDEEDNKYALRVAIVGRPNAGKSSLINKLLEEDRLLTLDKPGTTRDAVDSLLELNGKSYVLIDTAGIRRKSKVPADSVAEQDAKVLGLAVDRNRAVVLALNKWDLLRGSRDAQKKLTQDTRDVLAFAPWTRIVNISALTGAGLGDLFRAIDDAHNEFCKRVSTSELNRLFEDIVEHHPPPLRKSRPVKLYYAAQVSVRPPTFVVQCSYPEALHFSYQRYVQNRIRETFGFEGTPVRVLFRKRKRRGS